MAGREFDPGKVVGTGISRRKIGEEAPEGAGEALGAREGGRHQALRLESTREQGERAGGGQRIPKTGGGGVEGHQGPEEGVE